MSDMPSYVGDDKLSVQTIDAKSEGIPSPTRGGGAGVGRISPSDEVNGDYTGTYLDQYIEQDKKNKNAKRGNDDDAVVEMSGGERAFSARGSPTGSPKNNNVDDAAPPTAAAAASPTAIVAVPNESPAAPLPVDKTPKRELDDSKPRTVAMTYDKEELKRGRQHFFDFPDPTFYLGAALLIGCISLFTWMAAFIMDSGDIRSTYLWCITGGLAALFLIIPFIYYAVSSKHHHVCGKLWDGFCGAFPCCIAVFGIVFVYAFGIEIIVHTALNRNDPIKPTPIRDEFLIYGTIPLFLLVVLPTFLSMVKFQDKVSQRARLANPELVENNYDTQPITSSGFIYMAVMLRRIVVGWVCGVCVAAHITLPAYGLSWLAYGLYDLQEQEGIWVIFVILIPPILLIIVLAIIPITRVVPLALWSIVVQWFWYPLMSWDPRDGGFWYKYDNGLTYERLINQHNYEVKRAEKAYLNHQNEEADTFYAKAHETRVAIDQRGVKLGNVDYATGKVIPIEPKPGNNLDTEEGRAAEEERLRKAKEDAEAAELAAYDNNSANPMSPQAAAEAVKQKEKDLQEYYGYDNTAPQ